MTAPFSLHEVEITIYRTDALGDATGSPVWVGACENRLSLNGQFAEIDANISGQPWVNVRQLEERHDLDLENVWLSRFKDGVVEIPASMPRNQRLVVVLIWADFASGFWVKRVYFAVTIGGQSLSAGDDEVFMQRLPIRAGYYQQTSGRLEDGVPENTAISFGVVRYVSASETVDLYRYDFGSELFVPINADLFPGRAEILGASGAYRARVTIEGVLALAVAAADDQVLVRQLTAIGGTYAGTLPRLEFRVRNTRIASLSKAGELALAAYAEATEDPDLEADIQIRDGSIWVASLDATGLYAAGVTDAL